MPVCDAGMPYEVTGGVGAVFGAVHETTPLGPMQPGPEGAPAGFHSPGGSSCSTYFADAAADATNPLAHATAPTLVPLALTVGAAKGDVTSLCPGPHVFGDGPQ